VRVRILHVPDDVARERTQTPPTEDLSWD
jgi:hypothetical protein